MVTHKHIDKICCVVLAFTLILSVLFVNAEHFGVQKASMVMEYENTLFDTSRVHMIDIIMEDWDAFTQNCRNEEYYNCTVVIDEEECRNVGIRGKGNTSLTQVASYGNDRYSFKIEFDHYDSTKTFRGLDKLCLNNIIQDNTYMKDYLAYQMMNKMGVPSPLCSYVYITVNGQDWGLYLAVEGVEESFLQRNYGKDYGELYKPDSMKMGGGRGNGEKFDMDEFLGDSQGKSMDDDRSIKDPEFPDSDGSSGMPGGMPGGKLEDMPEGMPGGKPGGGFQMGSDDVLLKYIDDEIKSYSNIFDNAKTSVSNGDKSRLIKALKKLSNGENLGNTVEADKVIRYFVVHNFVLNFDSYTGAMIHNYYLYEKDGQMQMIPWDYNLAFGGFQAMGDAADLINYPIDSPVFSGDTKDRPMIAWIFENEKYTRLYHEYFSEFMTEYFHSGYFEEMMDGVASMISPYVEKDPTKFCTYEEFETGMATLKEFCLLRAESISGQLDGTIGSASDTQESDTLIKADHIQIEDMGAMGNAMGGGQMTPPDGQLEGSFGGAMERPEGNIQPKDDKQDISQPRAQTNFSADFWMLIGMSILVLALGLAAAFAYKRHK